jgi:uncharacterized protein (DUF1697 family)
MGRYAALLRGVSPTNAKMPELVRSFEAAGFTEVRTVLSSGNVVFSARAAPESALARKAEAAMNKEIGRSFLTIVRSLGALEGILASDPYQAFVLAPGAKRVVSFLRDPPQTKPRLPIELDGALILCLKGREAYSTYVPTPRGPVFMDLIEKTLGNAVTTRTWDTVKRIARS